jgi:voltage-gated potassium channel
VTRLERWERRTEWPLAGVALLFLATYSYEVLGHPSAPIRTVLETLNSVLYFAFVVDYLARLVLAEARLRWFVRHVFDLAVVALPFLRPLRLLRLAVLFSVLQRAVGGAVRGRVVVYTACSSLLLIYVASLAVLDAERTDPASDIRTFGQAVWWAVTTVTTVGYGDLSPVTPTGRCVAVLLMIGGISLLGVVTATLASWIVQRVAEEDDAHHAATSAEIRELRNEIRSLKDMLADRDVADRDDRETSVRR